MTIETLNEANKVKKRLDTLANTNYNRLRLESANHFNGIWLAYAN